MKAGVLLFLISPLLRYGAGVVGTDPSGGGDDSPSSNLCLDGACLCSCGLPALMGRNIPD